MRCSGGEMYISHTRLRVCLPLATFPHYYMDQDVTWGVPCSCTQLGRFAFGARVSLLWQHSTNSKCQRVLVLTLVPGYR